MSDVDFTLSSQSDYRPVPKNPSNFSKTPAILKSGDFATQHFPKLEASPNFTSALSIKHRAVRLLQTSPFLKMIQNVVYTILGKRGDARAQRNSQALAKSPIDGPLMGSTELRSDWQETTEPNRSESFAEATRPDVTQPTTRIYQTIRQRIFRYIEIGGIAGGILNFVISGVSFVVKILTAFSPLAPAIPFIGLFNTIAHASRFGIGVHELQFSRRLHRELKANAYDETTKNFGPCSAKVLAGYPKLMNMELSQSKLMEVLLAEVSRKRLKYTFVLAARVLGFGSSIAGFVGGLAAFAVPVFALPALCIGIPLAVLSIATDLLGKRLSNLRLHPLLRELQTPKATETINANLDV